MVFLLNTIFNVILLVVVLISLSNAEDTKWSKYLKLIKHEVVKYQKFNNTDCACYDQVLEDDFRVLPPITKKLFDSVLERTSQRNAQHYQIIDHKLYRNDKCIFPARCSGVEHFMLEIIADLPDMEFILNVYDNPIGYRGNDIVFSFSKVRGDTSDIMYPAWTFWEGGPAVYPIYSSGLGRWDLQRKIISDKAKLVPYDKKKNMGFFVGSRTTSERDPLILLSRAKPHLVNAGYTKNQAWKSDADTLGAPPAELVPLADHCGYKYLFNFRGVAASFRFKHLFLCDSVVFHVGSEWLEFFYEALKPWVHYIPVKKDLSDVEELLNFAIENDKVVRRIAKRGRNFIVTKLRLDDVRCYWKKLLLKYHEKMQYKVVRNKSLNEIKRKNKRNEL